MLAISIASCLFIMLSSLKGMPISGTHTMVGALLGGGVAALGFGAISLTKMNKIVASWFLSPVLSSTLCFVFIAISSVATLNGAKLPIEKRLKNLTLIAGFVFASITFMLMVLVKIPTKDVFGLCYIGVTFIAGVLGCRLFLATSCLPENSETNKYLYSLQFWSVDKFKDPQVATIITVDGMRQSIT